jgi:hypothetical protein
MIFVLRAYQPESRILSKDSPFDPAVIDRSNITLGRLSRMRKLSTAARGPEGAVEFPLRVLVV